MGHHHHHGHHHGAHGGHHHPAPEGGGRLLFAIGLNLLITVAEIIGGIVSGSLALLSDAVHNLSDTASLGVSYAARRIAGRDANERKTFGYRRAEIVGAFINLLTLLLVALFLIYEAVHRFLEPREVDGLVMLVVAVVGLLANVGTAVLLYRQSRESLNIRSAFLHIVSDGVSSVGVVIGGWLIMQYGFYLIDPIVTLGISAYLLWHSYHMLRQTIDILMEGAPPGLDLDAVMQDVQALPGVQDMHHLHVWQLDERHIALEAHIVIDESDMDRMEQIKRVIKQRLHDGYDITHSTLEFEFAPCEPGHDCYEQTVAAQGV